MTPLRCLPAALVALWCTVLVARLPGQSPELSVSTGAGFLSGVAKELVMDGSFAISELDWQMEPVFFEQTTLDLRASGGLHATLAVRAGLPMRSGIMTDSDWLNYQYDSTNTVQTNFSQSNCFTDRAISVDLRVGWEIAAGAGLRIEPFLYAGYMSWKWSGRDGYLQYPPGWFTPTGPSLPYPSYTTDPPMAVYGTGIIYDQTWLIPGAGARVAFRLSETWQFSAAVTFSPWLFCTAFDSHIFRQADFLDVMWGGWMIEPEVKAVFSFSPRAAVALEASLRHIGNLLGTDTVTTTGPAATPGAGAQTVYPNTAGAAFDALAVVITFSLTL